MCDQHKSFSCLCTNHSSYSFQSFLWAGEPIFVRAPVNLVSRDRSVCPIPQQTVHSSHPFSIQWLLPSLSPPYFFQQPHGAPLIDRQPPSGWSRACHGTQIMRTNGVYHLESTGKGPVVLKESRVTSTCGVLLSTRQARVQNIVHPLTPQMERAASYTVWLSTH